MTQCERILEYMQTHGSITQIEATEKCGCTRLAARISDLQNQGYGIEREFEKGKNRFNESTHYMRYRLRG